MKDNDQVKIYENYLAVGMQQMNEEEDAPVSSVGASMGLRGLIESLEKLGNDMQGNVGFYQDLIDTLKPTSPAFADLTVKAMGVMLGAFALKLQEEKELQDRFTAMWAQQVPENELAAVNGDVDEGVPAAQMDQGQLPVGNLPS
jgi:hypothetical protein